MDFPEDTPFIVWSMFSGNVSGHSRNSLFLFPPHPIAPLPNMFSWALVDPLSCTVYTLYQHLDSELIFSQPIDFDPSVSGKTRDLVFYLRNAYKNVFTPISREVYEQLVERFLVLTAL